MAQGKTLLPGVALLFALIAVLPATLGDRSPYVPDPVTYPGLLPQFTRTTTVAPPATAGGEHQQRPAPAKPATTPRPPAEERPKPTTTTTTEHAATAAGGEDNDLDERFGEEGGERPNRPQRPQRPQTQRPCDQQGGSVRVPCYDCVVYISRTGQITRFYPARENRDD